MTEINVEVGDRVIYHNGINSTVTTVIKITPTGRIRIEAAKYKQFDKYGVEMGVRLAWAPVGTIKKVEDLTDASYRKILNQTLTHKIGNIVLKHMPYSTSYEVTEEITKEVFEMLQKENM